MLSLDFLEKNYKEIDPDTSSALTRKLKAPESKPMSMAERLAKKRMEEKAKEAAKKTNADVEESSTGRANIKRTDSVLKEERNEKGNTNAHNQWLNNRSLFKDPPPPFTTS